jgi:hypothetical protein
LTPTDNTFARGAFGFGGAGGDPLVIEIAPNTGTTVTGTAVSIGANGLSGTTGEIFDCSTEPECSQT